MSRSRVTPTKLITLPRLVLMDTGTGVRLPNFVITSVRSKFTSFSTFLWSYSQIILHWIHHLHTIQAIHCQLCSRDQRLISCETLDLCPNCRQPSRFTHKRIVYITTAYHDSGSLGLHGYHQTLNGQRGLLLMYSPLNVHSIQTGEATDNIRIRLDYTSDTGQPQSYGPHCISDVSRYSQLRKLLSVTSYVLRFCNNLQHPTNTNLGLIIAKELCTARLVWIKSCQS